jgi:hypothetical protein
MKLTFLIIPLFLINFNGISQVSKIEPGFSKVEYTELLKISTRQSDSLYNKDLPAPEKFSRIYRSQVLGLDNRWELWTSPDSIATISIRGTTLKIESWIENFFAAMLPASGTIHLSDNQIYEYHLSNNNRASVHAGWLIGSVSLFQDILPKIDSCLSNGINDFYIIGHSQGGAISYLLTSMLNDLKAKDVKYKNLTIKTYASAAPKPGNLYYAYEYEALTQKGWAFNVVNSADWVPEGPFSIQTTNDYNTLNPFKYVDIALKNTSFPKNIILKHVYNQLDKPTKKAQNKFNKNLGQHMAKQIKNYFPDFKSPTFQESTNYVRVGKTVVLYADEEYYKIFPNTESEIWQHHKFEAYFYLLEKL